jgi:hypothetical protein
MKILKEPLFLFLLIGAALFGLNALVSDQPQDRENSVIRISVEDVAHLAAIHKKQWNRLPNETELENLIEGFIREQVFYREAVALDLDKDDTIVRRRMVQKMEFLFGDIGTLVDPTNAELEKHYQENSRRYTAQGRLSFVHIYLNPDRHGDQLETEINRIQNFLEQEGPEDANIPELGDPLMLPFRHDDTPVDQVDRMFGSGFADRLTEVEIGKWAGPIESGFGVHFVYVDARSPPRLLPLEQVLGDVKADFNYERRQRVELEAYLKLKEGYEIVIERPEE